MQISGLTKEEAQKCIKWIQAFQAEELTSTVNTMVHKYAKGVKSTLLD